MKKSSLIALLVLLVLATGLLLWLARAGRAPSAGDVASGTPVEGALAAVKREPVREHALELESDASTDRGPEGETRTEAATAASKTESWDPEESLWLTGTVRAACVDEGPLEVFGLSLATDAEALAREVTQKKKAVEGVRGARILSRALVAADGRFRLAFPPETKTAHVSVRGKYSYLPASQEIDVASTHDVVLTPTCGACIAGTITLPAGSEESAADVEGIEVALATSMEGMRGSVMNMERIRRKAVIHQGAFEFRALPAAIGYEMTIEPKVLAAARATQKDLAAGRSTPVEIALHRGGSIRGKVHDAEGQPVADAKVEAALPGRWFGFDNKTVRDVKSAADGTFELTAVTPGKIVVRATRDEFLDSDPAKLDLADGALVKDVELLLSQGKSVSGTVTWADGLPAAGVTIDLQFDMSQMYGMAAFNALRGAKGEARSGADGSFTIGGLGEGPFTLEVETAPDAAHAPTGDAGAATAVADASGATAAPPVKGFVDALSKSFKQDKSTYWRARLDGVAAGTSTVALVLRAPEGVAGRVTDEAGAPVAKFSVEANRMGKGPLASLGQEKRGESFEDSAGNFLLGGLQEGHWKITAGAQGFARSDALEFDIPRKADAEPLVIALVHGASVKGLVRTPAGAPIAGADISIDNGKPNWQNMLDGGNAPPKVNSQPDGSFLIEGLKPGKTALYAKHKEFARSISQPFDLAPAQVVEGAELVLREGGVLTGEVFADNGSPAVGMMVQASETKIFDQQMTFTDGRGKFEIEHLEPGTYQVVAMPTGNESASADDGAGSGGGDTQKNMMDMVSKMKTAMVDIKDGEKTHLVLGAPPADPVHVHGRVTHAGEPYSGSMLSFVREGKGRLNGMKTTQVDKDGNYSVKLDEPGGYLVSVQKVTGTAQQNAVEFPSEIPKDKDYKLDFVMPTGRISGRVLGPDGDPSAGTRVSLHPEDAITVGTMWGGQYTEMATDGEGRFDIQALRPGKYTLMVGGMMMGGLFGDDGGPGRQVRGDLRISEGEWLKGVDFRLKKSGAIDVEVVDDAGAPVGEAALFARNKDGKLLDRFSMITTDSNGKCKYGGLEPCTYFVSARKGSIASADSSPVRVEEGQRAKVKLALQSGTILTVEVFDGEDKLVKASVSVQDEDGRDVGGMIALSEIMKMFSEGGFSSTAQRFGPLPPGKYRVRATLADGKSLTKPVSLSGQAERKLSIRFM
jgi:hypothetical protein